MLDEAWKEILSNLPPSMQDRKNSGDAPKLGYLTPEQEELLRLVENIAPANNPPCQPQETGLLEEWAGSLSQSIKDVDRDIEVACRQVWSLMARRHSLLNAMARQHVKLSAIRRLPPEILQEIFHCSLDDDSMFFACGERHMWTTVWHISQVCSSWRTVSVGFAPLWSCLGCINLASAFKMRDPVALLQLFIDRAGPSQDISFELFPFVRYDDGLAAPTRAQANEFYTRLMSVLLPRISQWSSVDLSGYFPLANVARLLEESGAPRLSSLKFERDEGPDSVAFDFSALRSLRHVEQGGYLTQDLILPWATLKSYRRHDETTTNPSDEVIHVLSRALSLETLDLSGFGSGGPSSSDFRLSHTQLVELKVGNSDVLRYISVPSLKKLEIRTNNVGRHEIAGWIFQNPCIQLGPFITASKCSLTHLVFYDCFFEDDFVELLAEQTPNLESLCLRYMEYPDFDDGRTERALEELVTRMSDLVEDGEVDGLVVEDITIDTPPILPAKHSFAILPRLKKLTIMGNKKYGSMAYLGPCFIKMMSVRRRHSELKVSLSFNRSEEAMPFATKLWLRKHAINVAECW
ncbi:hypothetical protein CYLTODRAFT_442991 [Cylindrobasidium torrendii FP15055 ss-10]|uniref:Uncharacterized protein n=1 Tax=Cylindrobasidium torrendii FP15055 ss-10 TaxID=1314674 RepID=A0A0D7BH96_9AGAR|nr:hypothetical protein CYLTODRAFT_442991 [Cylindrobasidium torrendii FP15055 ss-10]